MSALKKLLTTTLFFSLLVTGLLRLSYWQLSRAHEKETLINTFQKNQQAPLTTLGALQGYTPPSPVSLRYRQISLTGHFLNKQSFYLDNKMHAHQSGLHIITPFLEDSLQKIVLIDRGFTPRPPQRNALQPIPPIIGAKTINVTLDVIQPHPFLLGQNKEIFTHYTIYQALDLSLLKPFFSQELFSYVGLLNPNQELTLSQYVLDWDITPLMSPKTHYGYALQWLAMAIAAVVIYFTLIIRQRRYKEIS